MGCIGLLVLALICAFMASALADDPYVLRRWVVFWSFGIILFLSLTAIVGEGKYYCFNNSSECQTEMASYTANIKKEVEAREEYCRGADIVSEKDGVILYEARCTGNRVYFSVNGTSYEECSGGRHSSCHTVTNPNANKKDDE